MIITSVDKNAGTGNLIYLSIGMQNGIAHWKTIWQLFIKINLCFSYDPAVPFPVIYSRKINNVHTKMCT